VLSLLLQQVEECSDVTVVFLLQVNEVNADTAEIENDDIPSELTDIQI
jgi:hypothetical protein